MPYKKNTRSDANAYGYSNSDWGGDQDDNKSTTCNLFMIGATLSRSTKK